jgi:hypothetical protein
MSGSVPVCPDLFQYFRIRSNMSGSIFRGTRGQRSTSIVYSKHCVQVQRAFRRVRDRGAKALCIVNIVYRCDVPFAECVTEEHKPMCVCKANFHGNGTDVCIPVGFTTEENKRGYRCRV